MKQKELDALRKFVSFPRDPEWYIHHDLAVEYLALRDAAEKVTDKSKCILLNIDTAKLIEALNALYKALEVTE